MFKYQLIIHMSLDQEQFNQIFTDLKGYFQTIDADNDGTITTAELGTFLTGDGVDEDSQLFINKPDSKWNVTGDNGPKSFFHILVNAFIYCP